MIIKMMDDLVLSFSDSYHISDGGDSHCYSYYYISS